MPTLSLSAHTLPRCSSATPRDMPLAAFPKCYLDALLTERSMTLEDWIELAARELELDGLELYTPLVAAHSPGELRGVREQMEQRGLRMPMLCHSPDFTQPQAFDRLTEIERQRDAIRRTRALGGRYCRILSGQHRPGLDRAHGIELVVDSFRAVLDDAARHEVVLVFEHHYKDGSWQYPEFALDPEIYLEILERVRDSEWLAVNYDPSNALIAGADPLELLERVKDRVATMHASDRHVVDGTLAELRAQGPHTGYAPQLRHGVIGEGVNDFDRILATLRQAGFRGWISIEDGDDADHGIEHLQRSIAFLRERMAAHQLP